MERLLIRPILLVTTRATGKHKEMPAHFRKGQHQHGHQCWPTIGPKGIHQHWVNLIHQHGEDAPSIESLYQESSRTIKLLTCPEAMANGNPFLQSSIAGFIPKIPVAKLLLNWGEQL